MTPWPSETTALVGLLRDHVALEKERKAADRNEAESLATPEEIGHIPDRPTGLQVWIVETAVVGDPKSFPNKERALRAFCRCDPGAPVAAFAIEAVEPAPEATAALLLRLFRKRNAMQTNLPPHPR